MSFKVIDAKNLPTSINLAFPITIWLFLDRLQAPGWIFGTYFTLYAMTFVHVLIRWYKQDETDIFKVRE